MSTGTSISQKATASISAPNGSGSRALVGDMPEHEWPLSEQCRVAGDAWVTLDHEARLLEATKDIELAERIADLGNVPVTKAERMVKATGSWREHVELIVAAHVEAARAAARIRTIRISLSSASDGASWRRHDIT